MKRSFILVDPDVNYAAGLARVHVQGWREAYGSLLPERFYGENEVARREQRWQELLETATEQQSLKAAISDGEVVGFSFTGPSRDADAVREWELYSIYILESWYGTGMAQALLNATLGMNPAQLWVARDNLRAQAFYTKNGFVLDGKSKTHPVLDGLEEVRMVR